MKNKAFEDFVEIIRTLRGEQGCPWDREQTHESLKNCLIEECYEVIEAINLKDPINLKEELGDVLLQVVMHSVIAEEEGEFTIEDVIKEIGNKMVKRHPHVFGTTNVKDTKEVLSNWEEIKRQEKQETTVSQSIQRIPKALPANIRAYKVQKKAAQYGFEFESYEQVLGKVFEELEELKMAKEQSDFIHIDEEFGDLMFSILNLSRFLKVNAENSLTNATDKFINRFVSVEGVAKDQGKTLKELTAEQLDVLWQEVKIEQFDSFN